MIDRFYPLSDGRRVRCESELWLGERDIYLYTQRFEDGQWLDVSTTFDVCLSYPGSRSDDDISASIRAYLAAPDCRLNNPYHEQWPLSQPLPMAV